MFQIERRQQLIILAIAVVLLFGAGYKYAVWQKVKSANEEKPALKQSETAGTADTAARDVKVHVAGAVEKPGVYQLPAGSRVDDAVRLAGVLPAADLNALNLAALLTDGQKVTVPLRQAMLPAGTGGASGAPAAGFTAGTGSDTQGQVNINTASQAELESLPGIGPALAGRIIQHREENGPFMVPEDIKNVSGIGDKRYEQLKNKITV